MRGQEAGGQAKRAEVILSVKRLYYSLLLSRMLAVVLHDMLDDMDKAVKKTQERLDAGSTTVTEIDPPRLRGADAPVRRRRDRDRHPAPSPNATPALAMSSAVRHRRTPASRRGAAINLLGIDLPGDAPAGGGVFRADRPGGARGGRRYEPLLRRRPRLRLRAEPYRADQPRSPTTTSTTRSPTSSSGLEWNLSLLQTSAKIDEARRARLTRATRHRVEAWRWRSARPTPTSRRRAR
ncbi:MAG: hypothetical protein U0802_11605 [Candidatus Binatia bacterium]